MNAGLHGGGGGEEEEAADIDTIMITQTHVTKQLLDKANSPTGRSDR